MLVGRLGSVDVRPKSESAAAAAAKVWSLSSKKSLVSSAVNSGNAKLSACNTSPLVGKAIAGAAAAGSPLVAAAIAVASEDGVSKCGAGDADMSIDFAAAAAAAASVAGAKDEGGGGELDGSQSDASFCCYFSGGGLSPAPISNASTSSLGRGSI